MKFYLSNITISVLSAFFIILPGICLSQVEDLKYSDKIFLMTSIVYTYMPEKTLQASAFFYNNITSWDIVSNRHVFYPDDQVPDSVVINFKFCEKMEDKPEWYPVHLNNSYLKNNLKIHPNKNVDVASIELNEIFKSFKSKAIFPAFAVVIPDSTELEIENPEIGDDVLIVGYPKGYYDDYNLIPIVKSGVIASFYRLNFKNLPCFIIDSKLFHGSSGSIVISKSVPWIFSKGEPVMAIRKDFTFLGIYSETRYALGQAVETDDEISVKKEYLDLAVVWYPWVLKELEPFIK